jgi:Flp pilus assembly protein TadD
LKRSSEAVSVLTKSFAATPSRPVAMGLSQALLSSGDSKKAVSVLSAWVASNPNDAEARLQYAGALLAAGNQPEAQREYELLLKQKPYDPVTLNDLAWLIQKENPPRAVAMAALAAKIAPNLPGVADTLGWIEFQGRDRQAALSELQRAHNLNTNDPEIAYHLAVALDAAGKRADAKVVLQSALARHVAFTDIDNARQLNARW